MFILVDKCADGVDVNSMHSFFQSITAKSDVVSKTPGLKRLQTAESNSAMFSGPFSSALCVHAEECNQRS